MASKKAIKYRNYHLYGVISIFSFFSSYKFVLRCKNKLMLYIESQFIYVFFHVCLMESKMAAKYRNQHFLWGILEATVS